MNRLKTLSIGSLVLLLLATAGCMDGDLKSFGVSPWPIYKEPAALKFTDAEKATLIKFATENKDLYAKIQGQSHAYRAIVQTHNKKALEINRKQLSSLGYDEETVRQTYPIKPNEPQAPAQPKLSGPPEEADAK